MRYVFQGGDANDLNAALEVAKAYLRDGRFAEALMLLAQIELFVERTPHVVTTVFKRDLIESKRDCTDALTPKATLTERRPEHVAKPASIDFHIIAWPKGPEMRMVFDRVGVAAVISGLAMVSVLIFADKIPWESLFGAA